MNYIKVNTTANYPLGAAEECKKALNSLGFSPQIKPQRGSHGAELYIPDREKERFENEIFSRGIQGTYRKFTFSRLGFGEYISPFYYVSYHY